jgi:hypothetical protein
MVCIELKNCYFILRGKAKIMPEKDFLKEC